MNRALLLIFLLPAVCFGLTGESRTFNYNRFYLHHENVSTGELDELIFMLDRAEAFFTLHFKYSHPDSLDIVITPSVSAMCSYLSVPSWIGGYYKPGTVFIQPVEVLKKKGVFEKVIFTEVAHDQIDGYTRGRCPPWFNEAASYYYYLLFSRTLSGPVIANRYFTTYSSLHALDHILKDKTAAHAFYRESLAFILYLNKITPGFCQRLFEKLREGETFDTAVAGLTGELPEQLYTRYIGKGNK